MIVQVKEASDLRGTPSTFVEVFFEQDQKVTQVLAATNRPVWNEKFTFDVNTGKENVLVNLCANEFGGRKVLGSCQYELQKLNPPDYIFDEWTPLRDKSNVTAGQIKISLQWIVSKVEYFGNLMKKLENEISDNEAELQYDEATLEVLYRKAF